MSLPGVEDWAAAEFLLVGALTIRRFLQAARYSDEGHLMGLHGPLAGVYRLFPRQAQKGGTYEPTV